MIEIIELVEGNLESMLNSGEIQCPSEDCTNRRFHVDIWQDDERGIVGNASCRDCELQIQLDLDDDSIGTAQSTLEGLKSELGQRTPPKIDRNRISVVD